MRLLSFSIALMVVSIILCGCQNKKSKSIETKPTSEPKKEQVIPNEIPEGMVWIMGGTFYQGADAKDKLAMSHEKPQHQVQVDGFFMDITEVTNAQFTAFVEATGYITIAERKIDWEEVKKQVPPGTPKPADSVLQPGSLVFKKPSHKLTNLNDFSQWWVWKIGANWRHPYGPNSTIEGKEDYPVVHISYKDAIAYCEWKGNRVPTEAEWEHAAKGGTPNTIYPWANEKEKLDQMANTWDGTFPETNNGDDGFTQAAPVKSFPPNAYGLYDMAGNVWEWTQDWYNLEYYKTLASNGTLTKNPKGADMPYNPYNPYAQEKIIKGGSFLCNANYCASYRISSRMGNSLDSAQEHVGFRTVKSIN